MFRRVQSIQRVDDEAGAQFGLKPSGLGRHDVAGALKKVPQKDRGELRAAFADLSAPGTPTGTVIREKARIKINVLLGYPPASKIPYDPAGALTAPAEIPDVRAAEKAALILHDGTADPLTLLRNVRLAHADAVLAAENLNENPSEMNRRTYFFTCLRLAAAIGLDSPMMTEVPDLERRMDEALTRLKKAEENHRR